MKVKNLVMFLVLAVSLLLVTGCGTNMLEFAADEDSGAACEYKASKDLDDGNWSAVIDSSCAGAMQKGAAYFGRAGYSTTDIISRMIETNKPDNEDDDINIFLKTLVTDVTSSSLNDLDSSVAQYTSVINDASASAEDKENARFYRDVFVNTLRGITNIKALIDPDGDGGISDCDRNGNKTPDEVDAASCALLIASGSNCNSLTNTTVGTTQGNLTFPSYTTLSPPQAYTGYKILVTATVDGNNETGCSEQDTSYDKLLFVKNSITSVAVTTSETCTGSDSRTWDCPFENADGAVDVVDVIDTVLQSAISTAQTLTGTESDVDESIGDLHSDICDADAADNDCTSADLAEYLQGLDINE